MAQTLAVRLVKSLGNVGSVDRTLAVCHLQLITSRLARLQNEDFVICGAYSAQLDKVWRAAQEIAFLDARIFYGTTPSDIDIVESNWQLWSDRLEQQLIDQDAQYSSELMRVVKDRLRLFSEVRSCVFAVVNKPDAYKQDCMLLLTHPLLPL